MAPVKRFLIFLLALLGPACSSFPAVGDATVDTSPECAAAAAFLATKLGLHKQVVVLDGELSSQGLYGYTQEADNAYVITLEYSLDKDAKTMVLVHELAHALVWDRRVDHGGQHRMAWGQAYAEVFRLWVGESPDSLDK